MVDDHAEAGGAVAEVAGRETRPQPVVDDHAMRLVPESAEGDNAKVLNRLAETAWTAQTSTVAAGRIALAGRFSNR
jgi:hypothetical protein